MTNEEMKMTGEALIALSEGKEIQAKVGSAWANYNPWDKGSPEPNLANYPFRIKPTPAKRLIRAEELPDNFWIALKNYGSLWKRPIAISRKTGSDGFAIGYLTDENSPKLQWLQVRPDIQDHLSDWEWSQDRIQIRSFWVEA